MPIKSEIETSRTALRKKLTGAFEEADLKTLVDILQACETHIEFDSDFPHAHNNGAKSINRILRDYGEVFSEEDKISLLKKAEYHYDSISEIGARQAKSNKLDRKYRALSNLWSGENCVLESANEAKKDQLHAKAILVRKGNESEIITSNSPAIDINFSDKITKSKGVAKKQKSPLEVAEDVTIIKRESAPVKKPPEPEADSAKYQGEYISKNSFDWVRD